MKTQTLIVVSVVAVFAFYFLQKQKNASSPATNPTTSGGTKTGATNQDAAHLTLAALDSQVGQDLFHWIANLGSKDKTANSDKNNVSVPQDNSATNYES